MKCGAGRVWIVRGELRGGTGSHNPENRTPLNRTQAEPSVQSTKSNKDESNPKLARTRVVLDS